MLSLPPGPRSPAAVEQKPRSQAPQEILQPRRADTGLPAAAYSVFAYSRPDERDEQSRLLQLGAQPRSHGAAVEKELHSPTQLEPSTTPAVAQALGATPRGC